MTYQYADLFSANMSY